MKPQLVIIDGKFTGEIVSPSDAIEITKCGDKFRKFLIRFGSDQEEYYLDGKNGREYLTIGRSGIFEWFKTVEEYKENYFKKGCTTILMSVL